MDAGKMDALMPPVPPEPFALIVGDAMQGRPPDALETALRHMGLRPERIEGDGAANAPTWFRLRFGGVSVLAGPAAAAAVSIADPEHPSTSLLAASLPRDWHQGGRCWMVVAERGEAAAARAQPTQMREFFKIMVLLVDLFDASHLFWSPARLWSDAPQFRTAIAEMLASGMPPVLHLVAFRRREGAAGADEIGTRGLALFAGQELAARMPDGWTVADMVKRLSRLALDMMLNGPVNAARTMRGLESGEWIDLSPRSGGDGQRSTVVVEFGRDR